MNILLNEKKKSLSVALETQNWCEAQRHDVTG